MLHVEFTQCVHNSVVKRAFPDENIGSHCRRGKQSGCANQLSCLFPVPALVKEQHHREQSKLHQTARSKGRNHGHGKHNIHRPQLLAVVPLYFIIVEEQAQKQEILVYPRLPEDSEIPVLYISQRNKGDTEKIKLDPVVDPDHGNTRHSPIRQEAQAVGADKRNYAQETQNIQINLCRVLQRQKQ